jgi:hypothetical protein
MTTTPPTDREMMQQDAKRALELMEKRNPPVPPAQAGEALTDEQYADFLKVALSQPQIDQFLNGGRVVLNAPVYRSIIDKAYAAGRQHAPAEPTVDTLRTARNLIAGQFEHEVTPPAVAEVLSGLAAAQPVQGLPDLLKDWLKREMPSGTVVGDPEWWAGKIAMVVMQSGHVSNGPVIAYASSTRPNYLMSAAQYDNCLPKNRTAYDIPLVAAKGQSQDGLSHRDSGSTSKDAERYAAIRKLLTEAVGAGIEANDPRLYYEQPEPGEEFRLYWYPDTPIGSYEIKGSTLDEVADAAIEAERKQKGGE